MKVQLFLLSLGMERKPKYKIGDVVTYTCDTDKKQYTFKIADVQEECYDDANEYTTFVYYDDVPSKSRSFLAEEDIDGLDKASVKITEESLLEDGWDYEQDYDQYYHYSKAIDNPKNSKWKFYLEIRPGSNTVGRDWYLHVDNNCFESVGTMDVATFGQIDKFIELLSE